MSEGFDEILNPNCMMGEAATFPNETKPPEPKYGEATWYRGWEAGQDDMAMRYTKESWIAYKGGCDLDAPKIAETSWAALMDAIDEEEEDENRD